MPNDGDSGQRQRTRPGLAAAIVVGVVVLDQATKLWAVRSLADGPVTIIGEVGFRLARNSGGAFSLFQAFTPFLALIAGIVAFFLIRTVRRTDDTLLVVALSLVLGGALGNLVDRVLRSGASGTRHFLRGAVVDFVHVGRFPTFNVADAAITVGAALVVVWALWGSGAREGAEGGAHG